MDIFATDPRTRDVGHHAHGLSFSFYTEEEVRCLVYSCLGGGRLFGVFIFLRRCSHLLCVPSL